MQWFVTYHKHAGRIPVEHYMGNSCGCPLQRDGLTCFHVRPLFPNHLASTTTGTKISETLLVAISVFAILEGVSSSVRIPWTQRRLSRLTTCMRCASTLHLSPTALKLFKIPSGSLISSSVRVTPRPPTFSQRLDTQVQRAHHARPGVHTTSLSWLHSGH